MDQENPEWTGVWRGNSELPLENLEILTPLPPKMHALGGVWTLSLKSLRGRHYEATTQANTGYIANLVSDV